MQLPEEIPNDLRDKLADTVEKKCVPYVVKHIPVDAIHRVFASYYNNLPVDWRPVSEKPEDESQIVWVTDGDFVEIASYSSTGFLASILLDSNITYWAYVESKKPEPPKVKP